MFNANQPFEEMKLGDPEHLLAAAEAAFVMGNDYVSKGDYRTASQFNEAAIALGVIGVLKELVSYKSLTVALSTDNGPQDEIDLPNPFEPKE